MLLLGPTIRARALQQNGQDAEKLTEHGLQLLHALCCLTEACTHHAKPGRYTFRGDVHIVLPLASRVFTAAVDASDVLHDAKPGTTAAASRLVPARRAT